MQVEKIASDWFTTEKPTMKWRISTVGGRKTITRKNVQSGYKTFKSAHAVCLHYARAYSKHAAEVLKHAEALIEPMTDRQYMILIKKHPAVDEVENCAMRDGAGDFWVYLKKGWKVKYTGHLIHEYTPMELYGGLMDIERCECFECTGPEEE